MRYILIFIFIYSYLWSDKLNYQSFKQKVLENSKTLQSNAMLESLAKTESELSLLSQNPSLDILAGRYNPKIGDDENGFSAGFSQSIRTSGYYDGLKKKALATKANANAKRVLSKAIFLKNIERLYTKYVYTHKQYEQLQIEYKIAQKITNMAYQQYQHGTKSKTHYLQAKNDAMMVKTMILSAKLDTQRALSKLLSISGIDKELELETMFIYPLTPISKLALNSPTKMMIAAKDLELSSQVTMSNSSIKSFDINAEFEKEPEQEITRLGLSVPIPIFNNSSKNRELAKLKILQAKLENEQILFSESIKAKTLLESINSLIEQHKELKELEKRQKHLVSLFEEGYKISKGSLLELLNAKRSWVTSQKRVINLEKEINNQKIELFYLQGKYND